jgi:hypothetical protein
MDVDNSRFDSHPHEHAGLFPPDTNLTVSSVTPFKNDPNNISMKRKRKQQNQYSDLLMNKIEQSRSQEIFYNSTLGAMLKGTYKVESMRRQRLLLCSENI